MATVDGKAYELLASITNQDSATKETTTDKFCLDTGLSLPVEDTDWHRSTDEACRTSDYEQGAPVPVAVSIAHTAGMVADDHALGFWSYWAMHGGAAEATPAEVLVAASATTFEHTFTRGDTTVHRAPTIEACADPANYTDAQRNRIVHNMLTSMTLSGERKGVLRLSLDMIGGGFTEDVTADPSGISNNRQQVLNFSMVHCFTNATNLDYNASFDTGAFLQTVTGAGFDDDYAKGRSNLNVTGLESLTADLQSFSLRPAWTVDLQRSYSPGNLSAADAAIVPHAGNWINGATGGQTLELEMVFTFTQASEQEKLIDEVRAGTQRSFELWVVPGIAAGLDATGDAYRGARYTFGGMYPVSYEMVTLAGEFATKGIKVVYRPGFEATPTAQAYRVNTSWDEATAVGA